MAKNQQAFLEQLRSRAGELVEVQKPVRPHDFEVTALLKQLDEVRRYPAVWFHHPTDLYEQPSAFSLLSNLYATRQRCALMLGVDPATPYRELTLAYLQAAGATVEPEVLRPSDAPVQENVWQEQDADVARLPIVRHFAMDLSPVLTMTQVMRSAEGWYDLSFAKTFYKWEPQRMVASIHTRDLSRIVKEYEDSGEPAPMINVLGHHPAFYLGAMAPSPSGTNDYETLGAFLGEPLRLAPSVTWGDRFMVPADAEVIIEGEIPPGERDVCDPFGEVTGLYQAQCLRPVFQVRAITFRSGAVMQDIFSGYRDSYVGFHSLVKEAMLEKLLRPRFPNVVAIHCPESGSGMRAAYISVRDARRGQIEEIGQAALATTFLMQCVVVVGADIDVFDENQVLWALHTYTDPEEGIKLQRGQRRNEPSFVPNAGFGATNWGTQKVVIDATRPTHFAFELRSEIPREAMERIRLADYVPGFTPSPSTGEGVGEPPDGGIR